MSLPNWGNFARESGLSRSKLMWDNLFCAVITSLGEMSILLDLGPCGLPTTMNGGLLLTRPTAPLCPLGGPCLDFDASNDYVVVGSSYDFDGPVTIAFWAKNDSNQSGTVIAINGTAENTSDWQVIQGWANEWKFGWNTFSIGGGTAQGTAAWKHVICTRNGSSGSWSGTMYIDGVQAFTNTTATNPNGSAAGLSLGGTPSGGALWSGKMMDFLIWNRGVNGDEAWAIYQACSTMDWLTPYIYTRQQGKAAAAAPSAKAAWYYEMMRRRRAA